MNLPEQVAQSITTRKLFPRGAKILVAVSGGVDSMVLLHLLHALALKHDWRLTVAHFNHQLRGRSSNADEKLVGVTAKKLGLPFVAGRADVRKFALGQKLSIEMAARELRHGFLARTAKQRKIPVVALAHHADDQVELFFLRLLRGSGGEGLAGMKWSASSPADSKIKLVRPLLDVGKAALEKFVRENKIRFREDASNASQDIQRNRIRRELLPLLRKSYSPALDRTILRVMEIVGAESEFVADAARSTKTVFLKLPVVLQRRVLQRQLLALEIELGFDLIEWLRANPNREVTINPQVSVSRYLSGELGIGKPVVLMGAARKKIFIVLKKSLSAIFAGVKISWRIERLAKFVRPKSVAEREFFDADKVGARIVLRHWLPGDRFQPIGMALSVKLQDFFVNAKIPRARRQELVVATTSGGEIFWVEGLRIGEQFKLTPQTVRKLDWRWRRVG